MSTRLALLHQQHAGSEFLVLVSWLAAASTTNGASWEWRARQRDMGVLGCPNRFETVLLERAGKLHRRHRIIGKEHRAAEMHTTLPCYRMCWRRRLAAGAS